MTSVEYDLDISGGLMEQVQAIIAPPVSNDTDKTKKSKISEHPYFKRPGKGHNRDLCDACLEGGDLICCDKCPASFHLQCYDPPLEEKDIPTGEWLCHCCKQTAKSKAEGKPQARNKRSTSSTSSTSSVKSVKKVKPNPMELLVKAASFLNPKQFELPKEMHIPCNFPGTDKVESQCNRKKNNKTANKQHERGPNGLVPLPARFCYECRKSCRVAPLLACDYCPLYFHLDCLNPPLTSFPSGRWMCPNHVEHAVDSKVLTSVSVSERVRLWDHFTGLVDQDAIKVQFIRKARNKNPPFRIKVKLAPRNRVVVPESIKNQYKNPPTLLPSLRDVMRLETVISRKTSDEALMDLEDDASFEADEPHSSGEYSEKDERVNGLVVLNGENVSSCSSSDDDRKETKSELAVVNKNSLETNIGSGSGGGEYFNGCAVSSSSNRKETDLIGSTTSNSRNSDIHYGILNGASIKKDQQDIVYNLNHEVERELKQLDDRLLKLLAYQRIQQLISTNSQQQQQLQPSSSMNLPNLMPNSRVHHTPLPSELLTPADIDRITRVFASPRSKSQNLQSQNGGGGGTNGCGTGNVNGNDASGAAGKTYSSLRARAMMCPVVSKHFYNVKNSQVEQSEMRHDTSFMGYRPTVSARFPEAVAMTYRTLSIGKGSGNDVDLDRFGHCCFVSPKHATIFFDEMTKHYELINYSCHGTFVNNVPFANDISDKPVVAPSTTTSSSSSTGGRKKSRAAAAAAEKEDKDKVPLEVQIRNIIDKRRGIQREEMSKSFEDIPKMIAIDCIDQADCYCNAAELQERLKGGWDGPAVLNHGALLRFGCVSFVFSMVECATF